MTNRLSKAQAQALAVKNLSEIEAALIASDWNATRDAAIRLAALASDRASKK
jgi:hypothetical protein